MVHISGDIRGEFAHGVTSSLAICHECPGEGTVVPEPWTLMSAVRHPSVAHGGCLTNRELNAQNIIAFGGKAKCDHNYKSNMLDYMLPRIRAKILVAVLGAIPARPHGFEPKSLVLFWGQFRLDCKKQRAGYQQLDYDTEINKRVTKKVILRSQSL